MTAYLFVTIKAHDLTWADDYKARVPAIVRQHAGELVAASGNVRRYEGAGSDPDRAVLLMFPSMAAIDAFVSDPAYAPYRAARLAASSGDAFAFASGPVE